MGSEAAKTGTLYEFDEFRLVPDEELLFRNGEPVPLNPKAFRVLVLLLERSGHLVQKSEILDLIWEDSFVEEGALSKAIWFVRQALGDISKEKFIQTVPRRGYRFVFPVSVINHLPDGIGRATQGNGSDNATNLSGLDHEPVNLTVPPGTDTGILRISKSKAILAGVACAVMGAAVLAAGLGLSDYFKARSTARLLDQTFANCGIIEDEAFVLEAVAIQPDGKIVAASYRGFYPDYNVAVFRYNPDGSRDSTFDDDGNVTTDFGGRDAAHAIALQPDGKILVAANSVVGSGSRFVVARYNSDGSLDASFDGDGKLITYIGGEDAAHSVALQPDGKIVVAGAGQGTNGLRDLAVVRYNADGSLDAGFDGDGIVTEDFNAATDAAYAVALQPDGKIIAGGTGDGLFTVVRYNADGSLDTSFDGDGQLTTGNGVVRSVAVQPDGKMIAAGSSSNALVLRRYNLNGSLDATFADNGTASINLQSSVGANATVLLPDGNIIVAGFATRSSSVVDSSIVVARYDSNGALDKTFDSDGIVVIEGDREQNRFSAVAAAVDIQGRIVIAGGAPSAVVYRFLGRP